ncbi:extracellular exo-alpha-L-arabinofuranosidase [Abditibacteriota bacterium]|nr:extracellular exo-alpha-L-arabinofuranosidase [Abditibacteriota bacterium]
MKFLSTHLVLASTLLVSGLAMAQAPARVQIDAARPGPAIGPLFYGMMTEEINHAYDGGLYAELIRNRSLRDDDNNPVNWTPIQKNGARVALSVDTSEPIAGTALTHCLRMDVMNLGQGTGNVGVVNEGYWGIPVVANQTYQVSLWAKASPGARGGLTLALESADGNQKYGTAEVEALTGEWKKYTLTMRGGAAPANTIGRFAAYAKGTGTVWMTLVSLMPPTYKNRPNGFRSDLMEKMAAMKPAYLRLPGGNYLEGITLQGKFDWKKTLGPLEQRPGHPGTWNYRSSDGLGLMEFLGWCDDLNIEPVLAVHAGYSLNGTYVNPGPDLEPYVQDALDEIEFLIGDQNTKWGKMRAQLGHPQPYKLTYVEIGNEDWFDRSGSYSGRYKQIHDAIKAKYPKLQLIATAAVRGVTPDVVDDHYYRSAAAMAADAGHYDNHSRTGPKIFVGEWASTEGNPTPTLKAALGDAAWLTGLERNADVVVMECYAPLFVNVNRGAQQWGTNLIGYNAAQSFGSPSFYVQSMFANYTGDRVLPSQVTMPPAPGAKPASGGIGVATWNTQAEFDDIKVTDPTGKVLYSQDFSNGGLGNFTTDNGNWVIQDGALRQTAEDENVRARAGDMNWTDYDLTLRARKIAGREGFLISFHNKGGDNYVWWNLGGWGNQRSAFQHGGGNSEFGTTDTTIETGRWYNVKISVRGDQIQGYLDGKLIVTTKDVPATPLPVYSAVSRDSKSGDVFVKLVNFSGDAQPVQIAGLNTRATVASGQQISGQPGDVNSIEQPMKVAPVPVTATVANNTFSATLPANSASVWRIAAR